MLTARVPQPHQGKVCGLAFHPQLMLVASAASDAKFKLWEGLPPSHSGEGAATKPLMQQGGENSGAAAVRWACRSVGYYRQTAATAVSFSADGTLLAVCYAPDVPKTRTQPQDKAEAHLCSHSPLCSLSPLARSLFGRRWSRCGTH